MVWLLLRFRGLSPPTFRQFAWRTASPSLKASGRSQKAWLWNSVSADSVFFLIDPSRSARVAMMLFASTEGTVFLACDRYAACRKLARELDGKVIPCFCRAHKPCTARTRDRQHGSWPASCSGCRPARSARSCPVSPAAEECLQGAHARRRGAVPPAPVRSSGRCWWPGDDGRKEIIDFPLAGTESAAEREHVLTDLHRRGLTGEGLEMICVDGGQGLLAALSVVHHRIPVQRCRAHEVPTILDKVRKADQEDVRVESAARRVADAWEHALSKAVVCLRNDLDELFTCLRYNTLAES